MNSNTELNYSNTICHDKDLGRFITKTPARDGLNWYIYAGNNPLRFVDPSGLANVESHQTETKTHYDAETNSVMTGDKYDMSIFDDPAVAQADINKQVGEVVEEGMEILSTTLTLGGLVPGLESKAFFASLALDGYSVSKGDMSKVEFGAKAVVGAIGIANPPIGVACAIGVLAIDEAFGDDNDGPIIPTQNMIDLSNELGSTLDWAEGLSE